MFLGTFFYNEECVNIFSTCFGNFFTVQQQFLFNCEQNNFSCNGMVIHGNNGNIFIFFFGDNHNDMIKISDNLRQG